MRGYDYTHLFPLPIANPDWLKQPHAWYISRIGISVSVVYITVRLHPDCRILWATCATIRVFAYSFLNAPTSHSTVVYVCYWAWPSWNCLQMFRQGWALRHPGVCQRIYTMMWRYSEANVPYSQDSAKTIFHSGIINVVLTVFIHGSPWIRFFSNAHRAFRLLSGAISYLSPTKCTHLLTFGIMDSNLSLKNLEVHQISPCDWKCWINAIALLYVCSRTRSPHTPLNCQFLQCTVKLPRRNSRCTSGALSASLFTSSKYSDKQV